MDTLVRVSESLQCTPSGNTIHISIYVMLCHGAQGTTLIYTDYTRNCGPWSCVTLQLNGIRAVNDRCLIFNITISDIIFEIKKAKNVIINVYL